MRLGRPDGRPGNMHQAQRKSSYRNTLTLNINFNHTYPHCVCMMKAGRSDFGTIWQLVRPRQKSQVS